MSLSHYSISQRNNHLKWSNLGFFSFVKELLLISTHSFNSVGLSKVVNITAFCFAPLDGCIIILIIRRLNKQSYILIVFGLLRQHEGELDCDSVKSQNKVDQRRHPENHCCGFYFLMILSFPFFFFLLSGWTWPRQPKKDGGELWEEDGWLATTSSWEQC